MAMGHLIEVMPIGTLLLIMYIIIDCIRQRGANLLRRIFFYSFLFYLLFVFHYTTGGFHYPPREEFWGTVLVQLVPFQFVSDLLTAYQFRGVDWFFWSSVRFTFYNLIMLLPMGIYLVMLFNISAIKKAALFIFLTSLTIEIYQLVFTYLGVVFPRGFDIDDLILNTLGGMAGYCLGILVIKLKKLT